VTTHISLRDIKILDHLRTLAVDVSPVAHAKLAACLALRGNIISFGFNSLKSHPFQKTFGKNEFSPFWHAETHAIHNARKRLTENEFERATLYVVRVKRPSESSRDWCLGMARPCRGCRRCIWDFGIHRVIYSQEDGYHCEDE
jgi:deoxycytidylate deaminase